MRTERQDEGSAMIEIALILPILILMLLGTLDVTVLLVQSMAIVDSATIGAEYGAARWEYASDTVDFKGLSGLIGSAYVPNYQSVAVISCSCGAGGSAVSCSGTCAGGAAPVQYAQVTATGNLPLLFGVTGLPGSITVKWIARNRVSWKAGN